MTRLKIWVAGLVAGLAALAAWGRVQRNRGAADEQARQIKQTYERVEAGNEAVRNSRDADRDAWIERLRGP